MKTLFLLISIAFCIYSEGQKTTACKIIKTFHIYSPGYWDYIAVNDKRLYVSHSTQVIVLNETTGDSIGVIPNTNGVHGIAFDNKLGRGYTSNGRSNNVTVFDLKTNKTITQIVTGADPDAILYDPSSNNVITCNGRGKSLSFIDPDSNKTVATIELSGTPEAAVADEAGKLYVNLEDKNQVVGVDIKKHAVISTWSLAPGEGPTGLAIDKTANRLFVGCEQLLVVMDCLKGTVVYQTKIGKGCDGVVFDDEHKLIFTSNGEGSISVIKENSRNKYKLLGKFPTKRGARTIAIDQEKQLIYLPTADFERVNQQNGRPKIVPGTFQVLVMNYSFRNSTK